MGKHMFGMSGFVGALTGGAAAPAGVDAADGVESVEPPLAQHVKTVPNMTAAQDGTLLDASAEGSETTGWIAQEHAAQIHDFEPAQDALVLVWDDRTPDAREPQVHIAEDTAQPGQLQVWMGRRMMAQIGGPAPLAEADLALVPLSVAQDLGFAPD
jgi:hypothetical protein